MEALKDLFDEKIVGVVELFIENPGKRFFLSDIANKTKINITTTFRILNRLVEKDFVKSTIIEKTRAYELEQNKKTQELMKFLRKEEEPMQLFIQEVSTYPRIKRIILESRDKRGAKIIIVGNFIQKERIDKKINELKIKYNFDINYVELSEEQYKQLKGFKSYSLEERIIWSSGPISSL